MSLMMPIFKRNLTTGNVEHRHIGAEHWPDFHAKNWYDAPDKVPLGPGQQAEPPKEPAVYVAPVKPYGAYGTVHGEGEPRRRPGAQVGNRNAVRKKA
jgi:hypothetical protein